MLSKQIGDLQSRVTRYYIIFVLMITTVPRVSNFYDINKGCSGVADAVLLFVTMAYIIAQFHWFTVSRTPNQSSFEPLHIESCLVLYAAIGLDVTLFSRVNSSVMGWLGLFTGNGALSAALVVLVVCIIGRTACGLAEYVVPFSIFALVQDIIVLLQLVGRNPLWLYGTSNFYGDGIVTNLARSYAGTMGNIGPMSNVLGMLAVLLLISSVQPTIDTPTKHFIRMTAYLTFAITLLLGTSAVIAGYLVVILAWAALLIGKRYNNPLISVVFILLVATVALLVVYCVDIPLTTLHEVHEILHGNVQDSFGSSRIYIWKDFLDKWKEQPLVGHGLDSAGLDGLGYFVRVDEETQTVFRGICVDGHSKWINLLHGGGIVTFLACLIYFANLFISLVKKYMQDGSVAVPACTLSVIFWVTVWSLSVSYINIDCVFYCVLGLTHVNFREEHYA